MRNLFKESVQMPRSGYRPECIAFTKNSITSIPKTRAD